MTFRSKLLVLFLGLCVFFQPVFAEGFRFSSQIKDRFVEKVLKDYPMLETQNVVVSIQSEPYLEGLVGTASSFSFSFPDKSDVMGRTLVPISFMDDQQKLKQKINVVVDVDVKASFVRTKTTLKKHAILSSENTEIVVLPYKGYNKGHLLAKESYEGKQVLSTLTQGTILATWMFDEVVLVRSGDRVRVLMQKPGYELDVKGVAEENGKKGQKIRVRMDLSSHKTLQCEVVNETTVKYSSIY